MHHQVDERPLIVTIQMDAACHDYFTALRSAHFPANINYLDAHLTLFHNLPGAELAAIIRQLARASQTTPPFTMTATGLMSLGRGVAFQLESPALTALRAQLAAAFSPWLVRQDRQKFRPHITIQNKVAPAQATGLKDHLSRGFCPFDVTAEGFQLWHYDGGPWSPAGALPFTGTA